MDNKEMILQLQQILRDLERGLAPCDQDVETDVSAVITAVYGILDTLLQYVENNACDICGSITQTCQCEADLVETTEIITKKKP